VREGRLHAPAGADGPRGGADVAADRDIAAHGERAHGVFRVEHDHEVGDVRADLEAPADAAGRDARRRGPGAVGQARDDEPRARLAGEDEAGFEDLEDGEAWRARAEARVVSGSEERERERGTLGEDAYRVRVGGPLWVWRSAQILGDQGRLEMRYDGG
jgi:hypothetical protein